MFTLLRISTFFVFSTAEARIGLMFSPFILRFLLPLVTYLPFSSFKITRPNFSSLSVTSFSFSDIVRSKSSLTIPSASFFA